MKTEIDIAQKFNSDTTLFLESLNLIDGHSD